jgi:hypothetical protein
MGILSAIGRSIFGESNESLATRLASENPFLLKLVKEFVTLDNGKKIEVLSIQVRGVLNSGIQGVDQENVYLGSTLHSTDSDLNPYSSDDPEWAPVICAIEDLQSEEYPFFNHVSDALTAQFGLCGGWDEWVRLIAVPLASLTFNRKGSLSIKLNIRAVYSISGHVTDLTTRHHLTYVNTESGYLDSIEQRERGKELAVSLAVLVAGIDGVRDAVEAEIITGFVRRQIALIDDEDDQAKTKKLMNDAVIREHALNSHADIRRRGFELADEAADFDSDIKFQIMELLLDVAGADDVAAKHETDFLNDLAHRIGLDLDEYKNMRDKALPISIYETNSDYSGGQIEGMLGITAAMSVAEKKSQLSKEYRKWNALKNSSDPIKSKQAKDMVQAIGELRKSL